jgi:PRTRC genetic system protein E
MSAGLETTTSEEIESEEDQQTPEVDDNDNEDEEDEDEVEEPDEALDTTPTDIVPIDTPEPTALSGIIQGLSLTLAPKGTILLAIARPGTGPELLVTIVPSSSKETEDANVPLVVSGAPEEIDEKLVGELAHYVPARRFVNKTGIEIAAATAREAEKAKAAAAKRAEAAKPQAKRGSLTVKVAPKGATLVVKDSADKSHDVAPGKRVVLPVGRYTITASKEHHEDKTITVTIGPTPHVEDVTLELAQPKLL